jgi:hypothetical protein
MPVTLETSVDGIIRTHAGEPDDQEFLRLVITTILAEENPAKLLAPMIRGYLLGRKRALVRAAEHVAFRGDDGTGIKISSTAAVAALSPVMAARLRPLLEEVIHIPGYGKVTWGSATVTQLEARAAMYSRQLDGIDLSIRDVRTAIATIQDHPGATCLNDVLSIAAT